MTHATHDHAANGTVPAPPVRRTWRNAVAQVAETARATLPPCNGRIERAVALVLSGHVELLPDGSARVVSQSNGAMRYGVTDHCTCPDAAEAPGGWCKHRLVVAIAKRASALASQQQPDDRIDGDQASLPGHHGTTASRHTVVEHHHAGTNMTEAAYSATAKAMKDGFEVFVTVRKPLHEQTAFYGELDALPDWLHTHGYAPATQGQEAPASSEPTTPTCPYHGLMKPSDKEPGSFFCPHKMGDGSWCKERWPTRTRGDG
jgi:hypothetical protein